MITQCRDLTCLKRESSEIHTTQLRPGVLRWLGRNDESRTERSEVGEREPESVGARQVMCLCSFYS